MRDTEYHYAESSGLELVLSGGLERVYPWHVHTRHWTAGLVLSGAVRLETRKRTRVLNAGAPFVIPPCRAHSLRLFADSSLAALCLSAPGKEGSRPPENLRAALRELRLRALPLGLSANTVDQFAKLVRALAARIAASPAQQAADTPMQPVMRLLMEKPEESLSLADMAALSGYSLRHFIRRFRQETGLTPHAFLLACRLRRARLLLRNRTAAAEAALAAGFTDQSHMHRLFRRHHGLTPGQFLRAGVTLPAH